MTEYLMRGFFLFTLTTIILGCKDKNGSETTYFGGEIVNPNTDYVVLYKNDDPIDTINLDENNRFLTKLDKVKEGLYHFSHKPEYQYVFIEKGDSILFRLNTLDFDESLVFSGKGAEKNNFLIEMFLLNEVEDKLVYDLYTSEADIFATRLDSLQNMKLELYTNLLDTYELSDDAKNITKAAIDYIHFANKEIYPYMHKKKNGLEKFKEVPTHFYAYRENLNYNDALLSYYKPYLDFMVMHVNNLSYVNCLTDCRKQNEAIEKSLHYHTHKLHLIDSLIKEQNLRDNLFRNTAYTYLLKDRNIANHKKFIKKFKTLSKNNKHNKEINELYTNLQNLENGKAIPQLALIKIDSSKTTFTNTATNQKTVYYFWSLHQKKHAKKINTYVEELREKFPNYSFVGININENHTDWINTIKSYNLDSNHQLRCENAKEIRERLAIHSLNKVIILQPDGTIINAFENMYNSSFKEMLQELQ